MMIFNLMCIMFSSSTSDSCTSDKNMISEFSENINGCKLNYLNFYYCQFYYLHVLFSFFLQSSYIQCYYLQIVIQSNSLKISVTVHLYRKAFLDNYALKCNSRTAHAIWFLLEVLKCVPHSVGGSGACVHAAFPIVPVRKNSVYVSFYMRIHTAHACAHTCSHCVHIALCPACAQTYCLRSNQIL